MKGYQRTSFHPEIDRTRCAYSIAAVTLFLNAVDCRSLLFTIQTSPLIMVAVVEPEACVRGNASKQLPGQLDRHPTVEVHPGHRFVSTCLVGGNFPGPVNASWT